MQGEKAHFKAVERTYRAEMPLGGSAADGARAASGTRTSHELHVNLGDALGERCRTFVGRVHVELREGQLLLRIGFMNRPDVRTGRAQAGHQNRPLKERHGQAAKRTLSRGREPPIISQHLFLTELIYTTGYI